ncbi:MAG: helix-turn-helix transcriptional regulator [Lachnospiraceae bacterium]|nr:helix-turn-helix transcriptional regulator [Lachnospiraceae bacterium]
MIRLRISELLEKQGHSKYWLYKKLEPMSYQNFNRIYKNETTGIKFDTLEKLRDAFGVPLDELFETVEDD